MLMNKLGMGLAGVIGKSLLTGKAGNVAKSAALSQCGKGAGKGSGKSAGGNGSGRGKGRASHDNPVEELLSALLQRQNPAASGVEEGPQERSKNTPDGVATPSNTPLALSRDMAIRLLAESLGSVIDGRIRLRHALLKKAHRAAALQAALLPVAGINQVETNTNTGSALVRYDATRLTREQMMENLLSAICSLVA